jgi:nicotinamide-nucleotide adenylyltransferase
MRRIAVTGRFQPLHNDHLDLMHRALSKADLLIVGITNPDARSLMEHPDSGHRHTGEANPYTYFERAAWVDAALRESAVDPARFIVTPFPLERPDLWESYIPAGTTQVIRAYSPWERSKAAALAACYPVEVIDGDPAIRITASDIRARIRAGDTTWSSLVPPAVSRSLA